MSERRKEQTAEFLLAFSWPIDQPVSQSVSQPTSLISVISKQLIHTASQQQLSHPNRNRAPSPFSRFQRRDRPWSCDQPAAAATQSSRLSQLRLAVSEAAALPIKTTPRLLQSATRAAGRTQQLQADRLSTARIRRRLGQRLQLRPRP